MNGSIFKSFTYPVKSKRIIFTILAAAALSAWQTSMQVFRAVEAILPAIKSAVSLIAGFAGFAALTVIPGYLVSIVGAISSEENPKFKWKEFADPQNKILIPFLKLSLVVLWSFLPLEMYLLLSGKNQSPPSIWTVLVLGLFSLFYYPMALLIVSATGKLMSSLLPSNVLEPIFKTRKLYLILLARFWLFGLLPFFIMPLWFVPVIGPFSVSFIALYLWTCGMKELNDFYLSNIDILKWQ
jgi:hypothetical protein